MSNAGNFFIRNTEGEASKKEGGDDDGQKSNYDENGEVEDRGDISAVEIGQSDEVAVVELWALMDAAVGLLALRNPVNKQVDDDDRDQRQGQADAEQQHELQDPAVVEFDRLVGLLECLQW
ncbi:hypothetical protein WICPIJ_008864 [Wickerhamomyces pijperi]|uniref:Uncharacterized protein n=1 Tax=Wickerhamomyces pijperi TaxID=599730 RepID=A0A9P8PU97_WICPI|nr:hypothetical protein WICPIJ_008864 [Wickerhamomyces pijperi]